MVDIKDLLRHSGELEERVKWLEEGLNKLINHYSYNTVPKEVRDIAQSYLDGEPTTADEFNEAQIQEGEELMKEYGDHER